ncbi:ribonuclease H-like domain-containing protein [Methanosarcina sp. KYL-1]|uniref:ribonuclease H family protein n=1 Tax=Methanosarcina sp. KYL-1 TaxID=2602068 RepID=UPI002101D055|nr:ribonuclease H family protein [Methanosarcina sp. KYL-1]MCQ1534609.1 ribonuclease H-like domain-containing protein [Methanosarcina sp. KYL-1]
MLEVYCDSSYNENEDSYIGCTVLRDSRQIHQSTTKVPADPSSNLECELAALNFAVALAKIFSDGEKELVIYNDSTEAVKAFQAKGPEIEKEFSESVARLSFEYIPREKVRQATADSLSKKFPIYFLDIPTFEVESFSRREDILSDIAQKGSSVFYLEKVEEKSTNKKTCYRVVIRSFEKILSDELLYLIKKGGAGTQVKAAEEIRKDLDDPKIRSSLEARGVRLENSYFLLTDETWGLRGTDSRAHSILPSSVPHRVICDEVDRSPENLFRRVERFR